MDTDYPSPEPPGELTKNTETVFLFSFALFNNLR